MKFSQYTLQELELLYSALSSLNSSPISSDILDELEKLIQMERCKLNTTATRLGARGSLA